MGDRLQSATYPTDDPGTFVGRILDGNGQEIFRLNSHWTEHGPLPDIASINYARK